MAKTDNQPQPFFDVTHPGQIAPSATSRDLVTSNKPAVDSDIRKIEPRGAPPLPGNAKPQKGKTDEFSKDSEPLNPPSMSAQMTSQTIPMSKPEDKVREEEIASRKQPKQQDKNQEDQEKINQPPDPPQQPPPPEKPPAQVIPATHPARNLIHFHKLRKTLRWLLILAAAAAAVAVIVNYFVLGWL